MMNVIAKALSAINEQFMLQLNTSEGARPSRDWLRLSYGRIASIGDYRGKLVRFPALDTR
jgi:hypothetical protein